MRFTNKSGLTTDLLWDGLAPDEGVAVGTFVADPPQSGASPLPHLDLCQAQVTSTTPIPCGRGLAPDEGVSVGTFVADPLQSGSSPLPHVEKRTPVKADLGQGQRGVTNNHRRGQADVNTELAQRLQR